MEPNAGGHLTGSEFDILVSGSNAADQDPSYTGLAAHLDRCAACRERFDRYRRQVEGLHHLQVEQGATVSDACPDKAKWFSLAAGVLEEGESAMLLDHAASCDACGTYLKEAVEDWNAVEMPPEALPALSPEFGARVAAQLRLQCASQQMARHVPKQEPEPMIIPTRTRPRMWRFRPMWGYIGAAAAALVAIITSTRVLQPDPGQLLARAYEAGRTRERRCLLRLRLKSSELQKGSPKIHTGSNFAAGWTSCTGVTMTRSLLCSLLLSSRTRRPKCTRTWAWCTWPGGWPTRIPRITKMPLNISVRDSGKVPIIQ
jgi:hypothetical protein